LCENSKEPSPPSVIPAANPPNKLINISFTFYSIFKNNLSIFVYQMGIVRAKFDQTQNGNEYDDKDDIRLVLQSALRLALLALENVLFFMRIPLYMERMKQVYLRFLYQFFVIVT
jgi:hypothetical protein